MSLRLILCQGLLVLLSSDATKKEMKCTKSVVVDDMITRRKYRFFLSVCVCVGGGGGDL